MTAAAGLFTLRLVRVAIGQIQLGELDVGEWRELTRNELSLLRQENDSLAYFQAV